MKNFTLGTINHNKKLYFSGIYYSTQKVQFSGVGGEAYKKIRISALQGDNTITQPFSDMTQILVLSDGKFAITILNMLTTKTKNMFVRHSGRFNTTKERIVELEDRIKSITKLKNKNNKKEKKRTEYVSYGTLSINLTST